MGISLYGLTPATTYDALIKTGDNEPLTASLKVLSDGVGTNLPMEASTTAINFTGALQQSGVAVPTAGQVAAKQDLLVSGTNIKTINSTSLLGSGNINVVTSPSGVAGAIQFSNGSAFASDATNLFWDDTNNRLGVGTNAPTSPLQVAGTITTQNLLSSGVIYGPSFWLQSDGTMALGQQSAGGGKLFIKGSGSTSATTSLLVQNSAGTAAVTVKDDLTTTFSGAMQVNANLTANGLFSGGNVSAGTNLFGTNFYINTAGNAAFGAQVNAVASAVVECVSTTKGFLPPRMTTTQINAIVSPANGLEVYNTTLACPCFYDGTGWRKVSHTTM